MKKNRQTRLGQALALGLSAAMMSALALVGAAPAAAAPGDYYSITGEVNEASGDPLANVQVSVWYEEEGSSPVNPTVLTAADGTFQLDGIPAGEHDVNFNLDGYGWVSVPVMIVDADVPLSSAVTMLPLTDASGATAVITGTGLVGETLTVTTTGWPADTEFTYQWFAPQAYNSGEIEGANSSTYVVTPDEIGRNIGVFVYGGVPDVSAPSQITASNSIAITAPKKAAIPAPVSDSAGLAAFLATNGSTPVDQVSTGLPAGAIDPGKSHTANVDWFGADSFVDVYAYSSPVFVGTFPVVNGVVQITLSPAVLGQLAAGTHTLVVIGQSSGSVQSVTLALGLAATGADFTVPVTVASLLLLIGAGLMFTRRRLAGRV